MIIAEIAQAHDGSLGFAHSFIEALADTGIHAVKFQTHIAEAESSIYEPFRINFSYQDKSRMDYWKRMEFSSDEWMGLKKHCHELGLEFISSPFSLAAVDLLEAIGVERYKIGSGEVTNLLLLEKISSTGKPIILSSGMSSLTELDTAFNFLDKKGIDVSILQCTTSYPTIPKEWGLNMIMELKKRYSTTIGFSDHSGNIYACLAAAALGAEIFEFHVKFHSKMFGPDTKSALNIEEIKVLTKGISEIQESLANPVDKKDVKKYMALKDMFEKSLAVNKNLEKGHIINIEDLETKKPKNKGLNASDYHYIIGKKLKVNKTRWDFLQKEDLE